MRCREVKNDHFSKSRLGQRGQVAVEYILLLVVGVMVWLILVNQLVSRDSNSPGLVVQKWYQIIQFIGSDKIDP
jgi:uncharacterized protein (UPF0333 family)